MPITFLTSEDEKKLVKSVNGVVPDESGNVEVEVGGGSLSSVEPAEDDIPKVFISGDIADISKKNEKVVSLLYRSETDSFDAVAKMKWQGNSSIYFDKHNFTVKLFTDETLEKKKKVNMRGWGKQSKFCLKANYVDITHARNIVSARLWSQIVATRSDADKAAFMTAAPNNGAIDGFPIKVYINGKYEGLYTWNIPKDAWMFGMDDEDLNNCVLCAEQNNNGNNNLALGSEFRAACVLDGSDWSVEVPDATTDEVKAGFNNFVSFVMTATDDDFRANLGNYANVQSLLDYFVYMIAMCGNDSAAKNMLMITENGGGLWYASMYDMDSTWGQDQQQSESATTIYPDDFHDTNSLLWERMIRCFTAELKENYTRLRGGVLNWPNIFDAFERFGDVIGSELYAKDQDCGYTLPGTAWNSIEYIEEWTMKRLAYTDSYFYTLGEEPYTITNNLTNASTSNTMTEVVSGDSYTATISANGGYVLDSVTVTMGGANVTADVYADGVVTIDSVTGDIVITAVAVEDASQVMYTITNNLTKTMNSNNAETVNEGDSYTATISAATGYTLDSLSVTMGGTEITATAVSGGTITIASVTGNIVITAIAVVETVEVGGGDLYTLTEAITSDGTNGTGVNTGVKPNVNAPDITVIVDFQLTAAASWGKTILDALGGSSSAKGLRFSYSNNYLSLVMSYGYDITQCANSDLNRHKVGASFDRTNNVVKIYADGSLVRTVNRADETVWLDGNEYELCLLGSYNSTHGTASCANGTIYHCDLYSGVLTDEQIIAKMASYE